MNFEEFKFQLEYLYTVNFRLKPSSIIECALVLEFLDLAREQPGPSLREAKKECASPACLTSADRIRSEPHLFYFDQSCMIWQLKLLGMQWLSLFNGHSNNLRSTGTEEGRAWGSPIIFSYNFHLQATLNQSAENASLFFVLGIPTFQATNLIVVRQWSLRIVRASFNCSTWLSTKFTRRSSYVRDVQTGGVDCVLTLVLLANRYKETNASWKQHKRQTWQSCTHAIRTWLHAAELTSVHNKYDGRVPIKYTRYR